MNDNIIKENISRTPKGSAWFRARIPEPMLIDINILNARRRPETFSETIKMLLERGLSSNGKHTTEPSSKSQES